MRVNSTMKTDVLTGCYRFWALYFLSILTLWGSALSGHAQSYYPDDIGNTWTLRSTDGIDERVVAIKGPETINGESLKIIEDQTNGNASQFFIKAEPDGVKVFRSVAALPLLGEVTFDYSPPQTFLPIPIDLNSQWTISSETEIPPTGKIRATNRAEVVAIEDVTVPAGTFQNCLRIEQEITLSLEDVADLITGVVMWLAPDVGLVKALDTSGVTFELIRYDIAGTQTAVQPKGKLATTWASLKKSTGK